MEYQPVNVRDLGRLEAGEVNPELMKSHGLIRNLKKPVKILGSGDVSAAYQVSAHAFSVSARDKIEEAGGSVTLLASEPPVRTKAGAGARGAEEKESGETPDPQVESEASEAEDEKA
mgnify:CR=1 FL=1